MKGDGLCVNSKEEQLMNFSHLLRNQGTDGIPGFSSLCPSGREWAREHDAQLIFERP